MRYFGFEPGNNKIKAGSSICAALTNFSDLHPPANLNDGKHFRILPLLQSFSPKRLNIFSALIVFSSACDHFIMVLSYGTSV